MTPESCRSKKREVEHDHDLEGSVGDSVAFPNPCKMVRVVSAARVNPRFMQFIAVVHYKVRKALRSVIQARDPLQRRELVVVGNGRHLRRKFRLWKSGCRWFCGLPL